MASTAIDREAVDQAVARGSALLKAGQFDDAQRTFRSALMIDPDNQRVLALIGLSLFKASQFAQARPVYEELVERAPGDPSHRLNLGLVCLKLGDTGRAIDALESSRALDPSQGRAVSYLGLAYARAGRFLEAYRAFLVARQTDLATEIAANLAPAERDRIRAEVEPRAEQPPAARDDGAPPASASHGPTSPRGAAPPNDGAPSERSVEIRLDSFASPAEASTNTVASAAARGDSLRFVLPQADAVPSPADGQSMISRAVEVASPAAAGASGGRVGAGSTAAIPLSQLAAEQQVRPEDGTDTFEITAGGALVLRVTERMLTRLDGVLATGGALSFEPATRRSRGAQTSERFDFGGSPMHAVTGAGYLIAAPDQHAFTAVTLDDDILYLREDIVFAFDASLRWESGNVPGMRGTLPVVQFRGDGAIALRTRRPLVRVRLSASTTLHVETSRLAGWIGRVIPRAVAAPAGGPLGARCVECSGEGVVLVDPATGPTGPTGVEASPREQARVETTESPAAASNEHDEQDSGHWLSSLGDASEPGAAGGGSGGDAR